MTVSHDESKTSSLYLIFTSQEDVRKVYEQHFWRWALKEDFHLKVTVRVRNTAENQE